MDGEDNHKVSIVIPTHNRKDKLMRLIRSLLDSTFPIKESDIIIVNDRSSDGTGDAVRTAFPGITIIENAEEGFISRSRNIGISASKGRYVLLIDDDNVVDPDLVGQLLSTFEGDASREIGIVGPLMLYLSRPEMIWCAGVKRNMTTSLTSFIGRGDADVGQYTDLMDSEDFPNSFMISREAIRKIGMFDEVMFPIHYEEADLGERVRRGGFRVVCNPLAKTWHDIPAPFKGDDKTRTHHLQNGVRAYYSGRNRVVFFKKYASTVSYILFISAFNWIMTGYYLKIILSAGNRDWKERVQLSRSYLSGVFDGMRARTGGDPHSTGGETSYSEDGPGANDRGGR